ncbi:unnamed protein product [Urochloa humidicola]
MANAFRPVTILSWNVRGLGDKIKCNNVRLAIPDPPPSIICLQETKLQHIDRFKVASFLPARLASSYTFQPSDVASGGIITAWEPSLFSLVSSSFQLYTLTTTFQATTTNLAFTLTNCYGPCHHPDKPLFLNELISLQASISGIWSVLGDFNLIRAPEEKSNNNFDAHEAGHFNGAIDTLALQEVPLLDRRFTWSNHQDEPILVKLDRFFISTEWSFLLPNSMVTSAAAAISDHCQIILSTSTTMPRPVLFRFNNHWTRLPGCAAVVSSAWNNVQGRSSTAKLALGLKRCRADLKVWQR